MLMRIGISKTQKTQEIITPLYKLSQMNLSLCLASCLTTFRLLAVDVVEELALVVFVLKLATKESRSGFAIRVAYTA